jgi:hypothetical protein
MTHGSEHLKISNAKQENAINRYKKTKFQLVKNNYAIWFNKQRKAQKLIPNYAWNNIKDKNVRNKQQNLWHQLSE